jgi:hypothetical protein
MPGPSLLPMFLAIGSLFGALAAVGAYLIAYDQYTRRMLRPDQNPRRMALETAATTFVFFFVASIVLAFVLDTAGPTKMSKMGAMHGIHAAVTRSISLLPS